MTPFTITWQYLFHHIPKIIITIFLLLISLAVVSKSFALFHALVEIFQVVLAMGIFIITWNVRKSTDNSYIAFLGGSFLIYGLLKLFHAITFGGAIPFQDGATADISYIFESFSNLLLSICFIIAPFSLDKKLPQGKTLFFFLALGGGVFTGALFAETLSILESFTYTFFSGAKLDLLTTFLLLMAMLLHYRLRSRFSAHFASLIIFALLVSIIAWSIKIIFSFSLIFSQFVWYLLCSFSHYCFYKAIIRIGLEEPQTKLVENLQRSRKEAFDEKEKAQRYLDVAGVILIALDETGTVTLVNKKGCDVLGFSEEEIIGKNWFTTFIPENYRQKSKNIYAKMMSGEDSQYLNFENTITAKNDAKKIITWKNVLLRNERGEITGTFSSGEDISEIRAIEKAAKQVELDWERTFEAVSDQIAIIDNNHTVLRINHAMAHNLGISPKQAAGIKCYKLFHQSNAPIPDCPQCLTIRDGRPHTIDLFEEKNQRHFVITTSPLLDENGENTSIVHVAHDVTELKETENKLLDMHADLENRVAKRTSDLSTANQKLRIEIDERQQIESTLKQREEQFRNLSREFNTLLDAIPDILMLISPDKNILWANIGAGLAFDTRPSEMVEKYCYDYMPCDCLPEDTDNNSCPAIAAFEGYSFDDNQIKFPDGKVRSFRAFPIKDEAGSNINVILIGTDITEKLSLENESQRSRHLAALGELAAGVAHEINNPINGIINYAQLIRNDCENDSQNWQIADRIIKEGDRIAGIVTNLLSFARAPQNEQKSQTSVDYIVNDVLSLIDFQLKKDRIIVKNSIPDNLKSIYANQHQMEQVLLNLINNSRYALNKKYQGSHPNKILEICGNNVQKDGVSYVHLTVKDHGIGIPQDIIRNILDPFYTTKPKNVGTGLGLSISHGIVTEHNGKLQIESTEGKYTTVTIELASQESHNE